MKLAILGGSFDPIHMGHLFLADAALTSLGYDRVILIPAFQSPFKIGAETASPADRIDMIAASIAGDPRLTFDECEIDREGVSYTIDTLKDIIARYRPEGKPGLIIGDDLASTFLNWRKPREIAELADIIIARRQPETGAANADSGDGCACAGSGSDYTCAAQTDSGHGWTGDFPYPHKALDNEILNVSSRLVREKISRGEAWRYLVHPGVRCVIEDRRLYGYGSGESAAAETTAAESARTVPEIRTGGLSETIARIENDVRCLLDSGRFIHSRNTALLAWDLCRRFGLDPQKAYLAGIAHDMCKEMGDKELIRLARSDGAGFTRLEQKKPGLLHGRAAAVQLRRKYGIADRDIIEAIRYHTTGTRDMGPLAKAVYISDKLEISRNGVDPALRLMCRSADLETLFAAVLDNTVSYLRSHHLDISYGTRRLLAAMHKRNK